MARKTQDWMPLRIGKMLAATAHLCAAEIGARTLIGAQYWTVGGPLLNDPEKLRRTARMTPAEWRKHGTAVLEHFQREGDYLRDADLDAELAKAEALYERKAEGARIANAKRDAKRTHSDADTARSPNVIPLADRTQSATPLPIPKPLSTKDSPPSEGADAPSLKAQLFGPCLKFIIENGRKTEDEARKLIGMWRSKHGEGATLQAVAQAQIHAASEPIGYITAALTKARHPSNTRPGAIALAQEIHEEFI